MAASDVSALIDLASTSDPTPTETVTPTPVEPAVEPDGAELPEPQIDDPEVPEPADTDVEKPVDGRTNPAAVRQALKAFRDLDPKNAPIARELNDAYGRYSAYRNVFPKVADAQAAKAMIDAVGGGDGLASLQETIKSVNETDSMLYTGDRRVLSSIREDMVAAGHPEAFGKLAGPYLEDLRQHDEKAYFAALKPHFFQGLVDVGLPQVIQNLTKALSGQTPNVEGVKALIGELSNWFDNLRNTVETGAKAGLDPERQAFEKERTEFQTTKQKEFQQQVATAADSHNNRALGTALKSYLQLPFFKNFNREAKIDIGNALKSRLFSELGQDKSYQTQMDAFFSSSTPDRSKIESYHAAKVDSMAARIVKNVLETRYPGFSRAGKAPAAAPKPGQSPVQASGAPTYVTTKPEWNDINWDKDPNKLLFISGRAYLKSGKFVAWGNKWKK